MSCLHIGIVCGLFVLLFVVFELLHYAGYPSIIQDYKFLLHFTVTNSSEFGVRHSFMFDFLPQKQGLYDPSLEKDSCGVGAVIDIEGAYTHKTGKDELISFYIT